METWITELTPLSFLERSADVHPDKVAVVYGPDRWTYRELAQRVQELAAALRAAGVGPGDRVAYLLPNVPEMLVAHFAVPLAGAVLVAINTRLSAEEVRYICDHSGPLLLVVDAAFAPSVAPVAGALETVRTIVTLVDPHGPPAGEPIPGSIAYADLLAGAAANDPADDVLPWTVDDERATISINYTSGTTGRPKGVMYSHRGAYLNALGEVLHSSFTHDSVYLWTLPMFHCNGWCTTWALVAVGGTQVCLREVRGDAIWQLIDTEGVTHLNGAPTVVATVLDSPRAHELDQPVVITTAAAPPSPTALARAERMGFSIVHVYGLTETYGPYSVCQWQHQWDGLDQEQRARLRARQGVGMIQAERMRVVEAELRDGQLVDVPADGTTMGEIVMRGNNVMKGYFRDDRGHREGVRGRLVPLRRPRRDAPRRLRRAARPGQGRRHLRRGEHLHDRGRAGGARPRRGARRRGDRCPGREVGRAAQGVRRAEAGGHHDRGGAARPRARPHRPLQGAAGGRVRRGAAEDLDGQDPEVRAARQGVGG